MLLRAQTFEVGLGAAHEVLQLVEDAPALGSIGLVTLQLAALTKVPASFTRSALEGAALPERRTCAYTVPASSKKW